MANVNFNLPAALSSSGNLSVNWKKFIQKFNNFLLASKMEGVGSDRKIAILLNIIGDEFVEVFNAMKITDEDKKNYEKVVQEFENYCTPKKKILYSRYCFYTRNQQKEEPFDNFVLDLQKLIGDCEFDTQRDSILRDRIVLGMCDKILQAKIIRMEESKVDLESVIEFCRVSERTNSQLKEVQGEQYAASKVDEVKSQQGRNTNRNSNERGNNNNQRRNKKRDGTPHGKTGESNHNSFNRGRSKSRNRNNNDTGNRNTNNNNSNDRCAFCNFVHFKQNFCPAKFKFCSSCGNQGHFAACCKNNAKIDSVQAEVFVDSIDRSVHELKTGWFENIRVENLEVEFKLDSGAAVNVVPFHLFKQFKLHNNQQLKCTAPNLETFGGYKISPAGFALI